MLGEAVGGKSTCQREVWGAAGDHVEDARARNAADELGGHVGGQLFGGEALAHDQADRNRGVEVAARNMADRVGHGEHREAEGERDAEQADADLGEAGGQDGATAATKNEPKRTNSLRQRTS